MPAWPPRRCDDTSSAFYVFCEYKVPSLVSYTYFGSFMDGTIYLTAARPDGLVGIMSDLDLSPEASIKLYCFIL